MPLPATPDVLALAAPLKPTEVFRLAVVCAEQGCRQEGGAACLRSPGISTVTRDLSEHTRAVSGLPVMRDDPVPASARA